MDNLPKGRMIIVNGCLLCLKEAESVGHLLAQACGFVFWVGLNAVGLCWSLFVNCLKHEEWGWGWSGVELCGMCPS